MGMLDNLLGSAQAQPAPQAAPQAQPPNLGGMLGQIGPLLLMMSGDRGSALAGATLLEQGRLREEQGRARGLQAQTLRYMVDKGVDPQAAQIMVQDPAAVRAWIAKGQEPWKYHRGLNDQGEEQEFIYNPNNPLQRQVIGGPKKVKPEIPSGFRTLDGGNLEPIPGGPADPAYKRLTGDHQKNAPAGYRYANPNDPNSELVAIPGGPAEKIPAELGARIGLAKSFLGQLEDYTDREGNKRPGLRKRIKEGEATGAIDVVKGKFGIGGPGEVHRLVASGADALLRNLTGAGMNLQEASEYTNRYRPTMQDTADSLLSKLDQLERELRSVMETVSKGRPASEAPGGLLGSVTRAAPATAPGGTTKSGIKWSVE